MVIVTYFELCKKILTQCAKNWISTFKKCIFPSTFWCTQVLLSNNMACQLLGFKSSELQKLTLDDFVLDPENGRGIETMAETEMFQKLSDNVATAACNGKVLVSGKVVSTYTCISLENN